MVNRLADTQSPYLRAHADNPVDWRPWGEAAFAEARERDVPVMVSIGYSTCHWCHVMARESFSDPDTAAQLNAGFVPVKVDREEHPEVDGAYLAAAAAFTSELGWPLTVFTTPDGRAFFAGTYWPPVARAPVPAFRDVLTAVAAAWRDRRGEVEQQGAAVAEALTRGAPSGEPVALDRGAIADVAGAVAALEDTRYGGFARGAAGPKFPMAPVLLFLRTRVVRHEAPGDSAVADRALDAMAASPLRDPVEGGFFRYATRPDWSVPHFERMLTDNAQLLDLAASAGDRATASGIVHFLLTVLRRAGGGFGAAQDSESWIDGVRSEGGYYARDEAARRELEPPAVDGKLVTGWNGLAVGALARAGVRWGEAEWISAAQRAAEHVLSDNVTAEGALVRASLDGTASSARATLADHGQLAGGLFALALATGDSAWAVRARSLVDDCLGPDGPRAPGGGDPVLADHGISLTADASDGDEPSGPSALADASLRAWLLGAGEHYRAAAEEIVTQHGAGAQAQPLGYGALLAVAARLAVAPRQVVVVTDEPTGPLAAAARGIDADVTAIVRAAQAEAFAASGFALFEDRAAPMPTAYDCTGSVCRLPVTDAAQLHA